MIYTFWAGDLPVYISACMETWRFEYKLLHFGNLNQYTNLDVEKIKRFTLPQISDIVRVHVLRDHGGYWLDADTIMITDKLPDVNMIGVPESRAAHCGYLHTEPHTKMFEKWARHQDKVINSTETPMFWATFANSFSDEFVAKHEDITIGDRTNMFPELYMIDGDLTTREKYEQFYFQEKYNLKDINPTDLLMLHNSWTPQWYKDLNYKEFMELDCTMSNILKEILL